MCLLFGPIFCITETEATHKKEEEEKMCEWLFHLNNCWLCQKCLVSYSVQIDVVKSRIRIWHQMVWRAVGCLGEGKKKMCLLLGHLWGEKEDPKEDTSSFSPHAEKVCEWLFHLNNCLRWQKSPVSLSILKSALLKHSNRKGANVAKGTRDLSFCVGKPHRSLQQPNSFYPALATMNPVLHT